MSYFDIITEDIIFIILSKIANKDSIINLWKSNVSISDILSKNNIWKMLIKFNYFINITKNYNIYELILIYYLCLLNRKLAILYIDNIYDTDINQSMIYEVFYENMNILINDNILHVSGIKNYIKLKKGIIMGMYHTSDIKDKLKLCILIYLYEIKKINSSIPEITDYHNGSFSLLSILHRYNKILYINLINFYQRKLSKIALKNIITRTYDEDYSITYENTICNNFFNEIVIIQDIKNRLCL